MIVDLFLVYSFIKRLTTPFDKWKAYELGIIDKDGNQLKKRRDLNTVAERDAFGIFDVMILKLKKLLAKVPGGQTRLGTYAAALWLIKENEQIMVNGESLTEEQIESKLETYFNYNTEQADVNTKFEQMFEDIGGAPANSAGGGAVAGIGVGPKGEPGIPKAVQKALTSKKRRIVR